jgi:hypothetical protein
MRYDMSLKCFFFGCDFQVLSITKDFGIDVRNIEEVNEFPIIVVSQKRNAVEDLFFLTDGIVTAIQTPYRSKFIKRTRFTVDQQQCKCSRCGYEAIIPTNYRELSVTQTRL